MQKKVDDLHLSAKSDKCGGRATVGSWAKPTFVGDRGTGLTNSYPPRINLEVKEQN